MPDEIDRAQELEQVQRDNSLRKQLDQPQHTPLVISGVRVCLDCEESIKDRLAIVPNAVRCVFCQDIFERQHKMDLTR